jgi:hypothetical protein
MQSVGVDGSNLNEAIFNSQNAVNTESSCSDRN